MAATPSARPYQIVVWGATGFTGQLVCKHIATSYQGRIKWAMAGRDASKLERVRSEISKINADCKDVPILVANALDGAEVGKMLSQTQVVIALAGPFTKYGTKIVEQSIEQGTHYCDITGEIPWVKRNLVKYSKQAQDKGVKIVHCCGYDSVPSDLGALMMVDHLQRQLGKRTSHIYHLVQDSKGAISGGTIASAKTMIIDEPASELMDMSRNAYYLAGAVGGAGTDKPAPMTPTYIQPAQAWAAPFIMEGCNARIVHLSNALCARASPPHPYGSDFKFTEMMGGGSGWAGWGKAQLITLVMGVAGLVLALPPLRALSAYFLPAPGQGPSLEAQTTGYWRHSLWALTEEPAGTPPTVVKGNIGDSRDPGYWSTSRMVLESGLCLALDAGKLAAAGLSPGGILTPASALGLVLVERLRGAGFTWSVEGAAGASGGAAAAAGGAAGKIKFDLDSIDENGLIGPANGKRSLAYEFCIPGTEDWEQRVKAIDSSVRVQRGGRGRIGCGEGQALCIGETHQAGWKQVLLRLAALEEVKEIRQCFFE